MTGPPSRWLALGTVALLAAMILAGGGTGSLVAATPLAVALVAGLLALAYWAIGTAIVTLPYFCWGVMEIVTDPAGRARAIAFSVLTIVAFLAALDAQRRR